MKYLFILLVYLFVLQLCSAQNISNVWVPDIGNGMYKNPIIHADYSDPDVISVKDDYYMVSSSFNHAPGLPILHSKDLVNWHIIGHALVQQVPVEAFKKVQHGNGVWAPSIRFHNNAFYIYYPDPDYGIYLIKADHIEGPWSAPKLVLEGKGLIDPCPFWDDNGKAYLVHALAGSRAGFKSVLLINGMNTAGDTITGNDVLVYDGHALDPTIEGPKLYKRNGYYYVFAPAGGVGTGWQIVLRSKNIYGPYERKVVLEQGVSSINGPHQGAWVQTSSGEDWFIHFQDKDAYGRIIHLEPMRWVNDWPQIGIDKNGNGIGEPVDEYKKPKVSKSCPIITPQESDECNTAAMGLQWQWQANPQLNWLYCYPGKGAYRFNSVLLPDTIKNLWDVPNILTQKFPAENFTATLKFQFAPKTNGEKFGLVVMGMSYAAVTITKKADGLHIAYVECQDAEHGKPETEKELGTIPEGDGYFRVNVQQGAICTFSYSTDGNTFTAAPASFKAVPGKWIGATLGVYCSRTQKINDAGFADMDWFRIEK